MFGAVCHFSAASDSHTQVLQTLYFISLHQLVTHTHTSYTNTVYHQSPSACDSHTQVLQTLHIISLNQLVTHTHKFYKHCMSSVFISQRLTHTSSTKTICHQSSSASDSHTQVLQNTACHHSPFEQILGKTINIVNVPIVIVLCSQLRFRSPPNRDHYNSGSHNNNANRASHQQKNWKSSYPELFA